ncbi:MAG TPA: hypothetical protein GXZ90_06285 [Clostridiales bacterium]|nr:hypothetical protein [Clostridiales bacterium]
MKGKPYNDLCIMGVRPIIASDKADADRIRKELKDDYNFYARVLRVFTKNKRNWMAKNYVNNIIKEIQYKYNNIWVVPPRR